MSEYPITAPGPYDGPAFDRALAAAIEDCTAGDGTISPALLGDWIRDQVPDPDEVEEEETYCEECERYTARHRYPTSLSADERRRHEALAAMESAIGKKVSAGWLNGKAEISPQTLLTAVRLAQHLSAYALASLETTAGNLDRAAKNLREAAPLLAELRELTDHRKDGTP